MFGHWLIQRCLVDVILEPTPSATTRLLQQDDIPTDSSVLPLIIGLQCEKNEPLNYASVNDNQLSTHWKIRK